MNHCYCSSDEQKKAVVCLGRQPETDIFVFDQKTILDVRGATPDNPPVILPGTRLIKWSG